MSKPYPGYPPSYRVVPKIGSYARQCFVIELLSIDGLDNTQTAQIQEKLEALVADIQARIPIIEATDVVAQSRFDPVLRHGLRLP